MTKAFVLLAALLGKSKIYIMLFELFYVFYIQGSDNCKKL